SRSARSVGVDEASGRSSYFVGRDATAWRTAVPSYASVRYERIYPNVDLIVYGRGREIEYDFVLAPGVRTEAIRLLVDGGTTSIDEGGNLRISTPSGVVSLSRPHVYQEDGSGRREIAGRYQAIGNGEIGFGIADHSTTHPLVIDPVLGYSTYLGGSDWDFASDLKADAAGNAYVCGYTASLDFPATTGQTASGGAYDAFVAKIRPDGSLDYATYLG